MFPKAKIATTVIVSTVLLSGCGLFGGEPAMKEIDPPQDVTYNEDGTKLEEGTSEDETSTDTQDDATAEMVTHELYLIDDKGFVVPESFQLPKAEAPAKQVLEYLVDGGPVSNMLPNGFRAVLPAGTEMTTNLLEDGTLVVNFSPEFAEYKAEDEKRILESITWTLTQFESIKNVKIKINGHDQNEMPVNKTPIQGELTRADGINVDNSGVVDVMNSDLLTLYFLSQQGDDHTYYVPITRRVSAISDENKIMATVVKELIDGPSLVSGLVSEFNLEAELLSDPEYKDGVVTLNFNEAIFGNLEKTMVSKHVLNSLVLSLTEQPGVESVSIQVGGKELSEPVVRPQTVNTGEF
ncbi:GerMN domain-containing protein [Bacillus sp. DJP31]|uniref:GerMN domain-containing protein n=1 Tax=Bacillus sp. DJP31 TaxID=3409789 RepID=UPI003BB4BA19